MKYWQCVSYVDNGTCVSDRLEQQHRLADKVQRDCRASEDLLDNVERKLNEVIYVFLSCLHVVAAVAWYCRPRHYAVAHITACLSLTELFEIFQSCTENGWNLIYLCLAHVYVMCMYEFTFLYIKLYITQSTVVFSNDDFDTLAMWAEWDKIAIQSWHWKGMYTASEDEGDQRKDGST